MAKKQDYVLIPLRGKRGRGKYALISGQDYDLVKQHQWYVTKHEYSRTCFSDVNFSMHRLIMLQFEHEDHKTIIDHADINKFNNTRKNLRWCTYSENKINTVLAKNNTSGIKGAFWSTDKRKWVAYIGKDDKNIYLGSYDDIYEANQAYAKAGIYVIWGVFQTYYPFKYGPTK